MKRTLDLNKLTPIRGNQFEILLCMNDFPNITEEERTVKRTFMTKFYNICSCKNECFNKVDFKKALEVYEDYGKMQIDEKFISVGALVKSMKVSEEDKSNNSNLLKESYAWTFGLTKICKSFFAMIYNVTLRQIDRLQNRIKKREGFEDKRSSNNTISDEILANTKIFLNNTIKDLILPSASNEIYTLPSFINFTQFYKDLCQHYKSEFNNPQPMSFPKFLKYFKTEFPHVKKLKKKTDYCDACCEYQTILADSKVPNEEKEEIRNNFNVHKELALNARKAYADHRLLFAKEEGYYVLSFDFAENILTPHLDPQPAGFYFHSRRKIDVFGICDENSGVQTNFLIDESQKIQKGPNMVISMLHYYITNFVPIGKIIILYADNAPGQNKNQTLVAYLCYLVQIIRRHPRIYLNFMIAGHTKFSPDRHFGTLKKKIKALGCESILDLIGENGIVKLSARDNEVILYKNPESGEKIFDWYDWDSFLKTKYGACVGIQSWHVIEVEENSSKIRVAPFVGEPFADYNNQITEGLLTGFPTIIEPQGLSETRKAKLKYFENFVTEKHRRFILNDF